jgi:hypothetical protein
MKLKNISTLFLVCVVMLFSGHLHATKWPDVYFEVKGKVFDWDTKTPLKDVRFLVFLNEGPYAESNGWKNKATISETLSLSDKVGQFTTVSVLFRGAQIKVHKIEVVAIREGYRTERFTYTLGSNENFPEIFVLEEALSGTITLPDTYLLKISEL